MHPPPSDLDRLQALYDRGKILAAYREGLAFGDLRGWSGARARILAGRIARQLGAPRRGAALILEAWRDDPADPAARYFGVQTLSQRRGSYAGWRRIRERPDLEEVDPVLQSDWHALQAVILANLRDFSRAEEQIRRAEEIAPDNPWVHVERAQVLEGQDRYEEALAAARRARELKPSLPAAVAYEAHLLTLLGRDHEGLEVLRTGSLEAESASLAMELANLLIELELLSEAQAALDRVEVVAPLAEKSTSHWLAWRRSHVAYLLGDRETALREARKADFPGCQAVAERLSSGAVGRRVHLDVPFVRQHHKTCAPATLTVLARYWDRPAEHLEVAETICYDGTPWESERRWAEENGYAVREFTVTWESLVALVDEGFPFTLTTSQATSSHLQAVIGYDAALGTILIRDPYERSVVEFVAADLLREHRESGPRGMVLVPLSAKARLEGLVLPEADLWDSLHGVSLGLERHDRAAAVASMERLDGLAPGHGLALKARRALCVYDDDRPAIYSLNEALLGLFPDSAVARRRFLPSLWDLASRKDRLAFLEKTCAARGVDPYFQVELARELKLDAREHPRALILLRGAIRRNPVNGHALQLLGDFLWDQERREEALEAYRFAACLEDKDEAVAEAYFKASRHLKRVDEVLRVLEDRFSRFMKKSRLPARTLAWAYEQLDSVARAFEVLDAAIASRPDDGELRLLAAEARGRAGHFDAARALLAASEGKCPRSDWLRACARLAERQGNLEEALGRWREVAASKPLEAEAHGSVARLLDLTEERAAAVAYLRSVSERFPHNRDISELLIAWLRDDDAAAEAAVRRYLELEPANAWARREHAITLAALDRLEEAFSEMDIARRLEPRSVSTFNVLGGLELRAGRATEARAALREAIRLRVDNEYAIRELIKAGATAEEKREDLRFVASKLRRQTLFEEGIEVFRREAGGLLPAEEVLGLLREAHAARPDLWYSWSALLRQLVEMDRGDEALEVARGLTARFPLLPGSWLEEARVHHARGEEAEETAALEQALRLNPSLTFPACRLSRIHEKAGDLARARATLVKALSLDPKDAEANGLLADVDWQLGKKEEALARTERMLRLDADQEWAWDKLREWTRELGKPSICIDLARQLALARPGRSGAWLRVARFLDSTCLEERLEAVRRELRASPCSEEAHDVHAETLALLERFDEAVNACKPACWSGSVPATLRRRSAWVEAQRGNRRAAIAQMRDALEAEPGSYWGWMYLANWLDDEGDAAGLLAASEKMVEVEPENALAYGYRGDAWRRTGNREGAKADLARAVELAPRYVFAADWLLRLLLEDGIIDEADRVLATSGPHLQESARIAFEVQIAAGRSDRQGALAGWKALCSLRAPADADLQAATRALVQSGWKEAHFEALEEVVRTADASGPTARFWVSRADRRSETACRALVEMLLAKEPPGDQIVQAYLNHLGENRKTSKLLGFIRRHRGALWKRTSLWGVAGYALVACGRLGEACSWLQEWPERPDVEPWMLANLTAGLHAYGCHAEALAVHRHALTLPADHSRPVHLLEVAFAEALDGRGDAAGAALTGVRQEDLPEWDRVTFQLAQILVLASPAAAGGGGESAEAAWRLRALSSRVLASKDQVALRRLVRSAVVVGRHRGGLPGLVFGAWWVVNAGLRLNLRLWLQGFLFRRRHGAGRPRSPAGGDTSGASQAAPGREGSPERFDPGGNPRERTQS